MCSLQIQIKGGKMDLISIRRKYKNIRNTVIAIFLVVLFITLYILIHEMYKSILSEKIYVSYSKQCEQAEIKEKMILEQKKAKEEEERRAKIPKLTEQGKSNMDNLYHSETKRVFLTFDDGPSQSVTIPILDILKQENVKATFFLLGSRVELNSEIVKREFDEGHYLASHGYSHVYSQIYASPQSVLDEYNKSVEAIRNTIGEPDYNPHLFRFPGGYYGGKYYSVKQGALELLEQNEVLHVDWNALTSDAAGCTTTDEFLAELEKTVPKHNSVVVLMHDSGTKKATAEALPQIISYFRDRGFEFENFYSIIK